MKTRILRDYRFWFLFSHWRSHWDAVWRWIKRLSVILYLRNQTSLKRQVNCWLAVILRPKNLKSWDLLWLLLLPTLVFSRKSLWMWMAFLKNWWTSLMDLFKKVNHLCSQWKRNLMRGNVRSLRWETLHVKVKVWIESIERSYPKQWERNLEKSWSNSNKSWLSILRLKFSKIRHMLLVESKLYLCCTISLAVYLVIQKIRSKQSYCLRLSLSLNGFTTLCTIFTVRRGLALIFKSTKIPNFWAGKTSNCWS